MGIVSAAVTVLVAFVVLIVGLTAVELLRRHGWRPVDRLADLVSYGPASGPALGGANVEAPALALNSSAADELDLDLA